MDDGSVRHSDAFGDEFAAGVLDELPYRLRPEDIPKVSAEQLSSLLLGVIAAHLRRAHKSQIKAILENFTRKGADLLQKKNYGGYEKIARAFLLAGKYLTNLNRKDVRTVVHEEAPVKGRTYHTWDAWVSMVMRSSGPRLQPTNPEDRAAIRRLERRRPRPRSSLRLGGASPAF